VNRLPWFLAREAPDVELEHRVDSPAEAAGLVAALSDLGARSAILLCNPIPAADAMDGEEVAAASREAELRAERDSVHGKGRTPYLLAALADITGGRSLDANLALLEDNARMAGEVAAEISAARSG
jgi:pseudouridine-5'-phosphate glycosidase